jgi:hypothetical protein
MMQSCASAAKLRGGGPILNRGSKTIVLHRVAATSVRACRDYEKTGGDLFACLDDGQTTGLAPTKYELIINTKTTKGLGPHHPTNTSRTRRRGDRIAALMSPIGTFRTWRDVRLESVMRSKADVTYGNRSPLGLRRLFGGSTTTPSQTMRPAISSNSSLSYRGSVSPDFGGSNLLCP